MTETLKVCSKCDKPSPIEDFHKDRTKPDGVHTHCRTCRRERYYGNLEEERRKGREGHRRRRAYYLKQNRICHLRNFGLTIEDYEVMHKQQSGLCAICSQPERNRRLAVDHDHNTGKVRGLLCSKCNRGVGYFDDEVRRLKAAIDYLERTS